MNYVFAGMKHCGKSTMGRYLAELLDCPFYDTDELIYDDYVRSGGMLPNLREVYREEGPEYLKREEIKIINYLKDGGIAEDTDNIVSLGGGVPMHLDLILPLMELGHVIYLVNTPEVLYERVEKTGPVPFLDDKNPKEDFFKLCKEREPYYILHANTIIDLTGKDLEESKAEIRRFIGDMNNARK